MPMAKQGEKLSFEPYRGVRDFYPEDQVVLRYLFEHMERVCELFGYEGNDADFRAYGGGQGPRNIASCTMVFNSKCLPVRTTPARAASRTLAIECGYRGRLR